MSGFERERLHIGTSLLTFLIALMIEQPIPDEPPVTTITAARFKYSDGVGIFCVQLSESSGFNRIR